MTAERSSADQPRARTAALESLAESASDNIPGVDFASVTLLGADQRLQTIAATEQLAELLDALQYELGEGPCYAAVTHERFVLVNDVAAAEAFPRFGPKAAALGLGAHAAIQLVHDGEQAGLNLYARTPGAFDRSTVQFAELFATHAGALLNYAEQVEQLSVALHTRTDIGVAVGILMERYQIDRNRAFAFLVRNSNDRNIKLRVLALHIIHGTFTSTREQSDRSLEWP